jgi:hypothetical protein
LLGKANGVIVLLGDWIVFNSIFIDMLLRVLAIGTLSFLVVGF